MRCSPELVAAFKSFHVALDAVKEWSDNFRAACKRDAARREEGSRFLAAISLETRAWLMSLPPTIYDPDGPTTMVTRVIGVIGQAPYKGQETNHANQPTDN